ncbi:26493_t:CDS:1, partial [Gigaspora margarita]
MSSLNELTELFRIRVLRHHENILKFLGIILSIERHISELANGETAK